MLHERGRTLVVGIDAAGGSVESCAQYAGDGLGSSQGGVVPGLTYRLSII